MEEDLGHRRGAVLYGREYGAFAGVDRVEGEVQGERPVIRSVQQWVADGGHPYSSTYMSMKHTPLGLWVLTVEVSATTSELTLDQWTS